MVIVRVVGGLGNQLFLYATGRAIAHHKNTVLKLDIRRFQSDSQRSYRLGLFNIMENFASEAESKRLAPRRSDYWAWLGKQFKKTVLPQYIDPVVEESPEVWSEIYRKPIVYLVGYWQRPEYFESLSSALQSEFTLKQPPSEINQRFIDAIKNSNSVSVHVRRGDYANDPGVQRIHGLLGPSYYENAIRYISDRIEHAKFFVFSDDIQWVRENLRLPDPTYFVEHNGSNNDCEDLRLMSHCKHHIIANSTFSWWGAWLRHRQPSIVIAPKQWFSKEEADRRRVPNIALSDWVQL